MAVFVVIGIARATPRLADGALTVVHNDQLHYGGHLVAGRILSLCPCTAQLAQNQYVRGMYHARTPHQEALLTTARPTSLRAQLSEARQMAASVMRHVGNRLTHA
jgi:hypothetical protein